MIESHVVDIDGSFVGAAVRLSDGYRFVAVDVRLDELDGMVWPNLFELRQKVRHRALAIRGPLLKGAATGERLGDQQEA
jgi:hypothetical protein